MNHLFRATLILLVLPLTGYCNECVILLHGLARTDASMAKLEKALKNEGYNTVNVDYPSRKHAIAKLAQETIPKALEQCPESKKISFVTHSLGGILVRQYLSHSEIDNLHHVVMLGPPNKGSGVVDNLRNFPGFTFITGPAGLQLGTGAMSVPNKLGPANFSLGVIAGTKTINLVLSTMLPGPNDGKVAVENTKVEGMKDHITLPVTHPFMMSNPKVIKQVLNFLKRGQFNPPDHNKAEQPG